MLHNVRIIDIDNRRICAVRLQLNLCKHILIIICVYMPCDTYSNVNINDEYEACIKDAVQVHSHFTYNVLL